MELKGKKNKTRDQKEGKNSKRNKNSFIKE